MLLIILSWIYVTFIAINLGFCCDKIMRLKVSDFCVTAVLGLFTTTILTGIWAIFGRINIEFHASLLVLNLLIYYRYRKQINSRYVDFYEQFKNLPLLLKSSLAVITLLILARCSSSPSIIDNETYYIQTIRWLNEYGFVNGLANLHIFFAQTSGWHILQSAFSFSFLDLNLNDISGFCLLLGNIFALFKCNEYFKNANRNFLIVGLFPLANVFFLQFIAAPSPDIAVYVLTFMALFYFLENFETIDISQFNVLCLLIFFILFIKVMSFGLLLFPLAILILHRKKLYRNLLPVSLAGVLVLSLFMIKNSIISGLPLFPTSLVRLSCLDFTVPQNIMDFYFSTYKRYRFFVMHQEFELMTLAQISGKWFFHSIFNIATVAVFAVAPFFIYRYYNAKSFWIAYGVLLIQFALLLWISPVFRFFIQFTLFFSFLIIAVWLVKKERILNLYAISIVLAFLSILFPLQNGSFTLKNLLVPQPNSDLKTDYQTFKKGNLSYTSPTADLLFWETGNGNLPCVNYHQLDFLEKRLHTVPQKRTNNIKDGFYTKTIAQHE